MEINMKKILTVFGTFVVVSLIFLGLTNMDEVKKVLNIDQAESTETLEASENGVEAFVESDEATVAQFDQGQLPQGEMPQDGQRPERGDLEFDGERPEPPADWDGTFPEDSHTGPTSTTTE